MSDEQSIRDEMEPQSERGTAEALGFREAYREPQGEQGTEEPEWEYSWQGSDWCLDDRVWDTVQEVESAPEASWARRERGQIVRRRKAGPWMPVEQGDDQTTNHEICAQKGGE